MSAARHSAASESHVVQLEARRPRFRVRLTDGDCLEAVDVEPMPDWPRYMRITTQPTRVDYDSAVNAGRRVPDALRHRRIHERRIKEIVEL